MNSNSNHSDSKPLNTKQMSVSEDKKWIIANGQRFKRTVLPSPMEKRAAKADEEALLEELQEEEQG